MNENECTLLSLLIASKHCTSLRFISTSYTASTKFLDFSTDDHENIRWGKFEQFTSKILSARWSRKHLSTTPLTSTSLEVVDEEDVGVMDCQN